MCSGSPSSWRRRLPPGATWSAPRPVLRWAGRRGAPARPHRRSPIRRNSTEPTCGIGCLVPSVVSHIYASEHGHDLQVRVAASSVRRAGTMPIQVGVARSGALHAPWWEYRGAVRLGLAALVRWPAIADGLGCAARCRSRLLITGRAHRGTPAGQLTAIGASSQQVPSQSNRKEEP
jgi:hypothetical protein